MTLARLLWRSDRAVPHRVSMATASTRPGKNDGAGPTFVGRSHAPAVALQLPYLGDLVEDDELYLR
ncbi:MAG TPA: hypothetical protein VGV93_07560 [Acidimicrobiales bacterium]|nr:hypothetical protein [Acidimicrobiales bacterium]